jgi:hypothetical protein
MAKFKKGDRVVVKHGYEYAGYRGTVDEDGSQVPWIVMDDGRRVALSEDMLEPVEPAVEAGSKFKKGDRVRVVSGVYRSVFRGDRGTVAEDGSGIPWVDMDGGGRRAYPQDRLELIEEPVGGTAEEDDAASLLASAATLVAGDRDRQHGAKADNFGRIATMWNAWLNTRKDSTAPLSPHDVAVMMAVMKLARTQSGEHNRDDYVDACGYAACAGELA